MGDKQEKFYSRQLIGEKKWRLRNTGQRIVVAEWLPTFIFKHHEDYIIIEEISGCAVGRGATEKEAIDNTREMLRDKGKKEVLEIIENDVISQDVSPKFRPKMREAITGWLREIEEANS